MTRNTFLKFLSISISNLKKFLLVNLLFLVPFSVFAFTASQLVPALIHYADFFNISVSDVAAAPKRVVLVFIWGKSGDNLWEEDMVYVFPRESFNGIRKHVFMSAYSEYSRHVLRERALGYGRVQHYRQPISISDREGSHLLTIQVKNVREESVEFLFYSPRRARSGRLIPLYAFLMGMSFIFLAGFLGGITEFTQRIIFHEMRDFQFLFQSIRRNFFRSIFIASILVLVLGAVSANIYFYIFMLSTDVSVFIAAVNFWMLVFFFIALLWSYPLIILEREESVWKVVKKSLYISFDNLEFAIRTLLLLLLMGFLSLCTFTLFPGGAGILSFLNSALKELSARYTRTDSA